MENDDTVTGGEELSIDEAAAAYTQAMAKEAPQSQSDDTTEDEGETTDDELQASDEDVSEETDGETETEGQADEEDDGEEPETEKGRYVAHNGRVKLPDGTESTIAELIQGNLRDRDYRQKTMAAADKVKAADAAEAAAKASRELFEQNAAYVADLVRSIVPPPPDPSLADPNSPDYDPARYQAEDVAHRQWAQHLAYIQQQQDTAAKARQSETVAERNARLEDEWRLAEERVPVLKDQKKGAAFIEDIKRFAPTYGYKPEELANIALDHRNFVVLEKAILWDKLQASKPKVQDKVQGRPPVQRGGNRQTPDARRARAASDATNRLKETGRLDDAVAVYLASHKGR